LGPISPFFVNHPPMPTSITCKSSAGSALASTMLLAYMKSIESVFAEFGRDKSVAYTSSREFEGPCWSWCHLTWGSSSSTSNFWGSCSDFCPTILSRNVKIHDLWYHSFRVANIFLGLFCGHR
jgi:hypothetical protein